MLRGTSMLTTCCVAVCILLHCWLMIMNVVAGTYCVPGTTCSGASTAPCTQTASGSGTCSCSASLVPESTVCVPWGRCTLLHPHCGTLRTLKHSILRQTTEALLQKDMPVVEGIVCMAQTYRLDCLHFC